MDKQPEGGAEVIIASFLRVVYPLKNPSNACLSYLDNGAKSTEREERAERADC